MNTKHPPLPFQGSGTPLTQAGFQAVCDRLSCQPADLWAVLTVETDGCGFLPDRRPVILYESHQFHRLTGGRFSGSHPEISNPRWVRDYGAGGGHQYDRLHQAMALSRGAAISSTSWGIGQVMGFNAVMAGYADAEAMAIAMAASEDAQLMAMAGEILRNRLETPLRQHRWAMFAWGYNGPGYQKNRYDARLAEAYARFCAAPAPSLVARGVQVVLGYLGYPCGAPDGIVGPRTRRALVDFRADRADRLSGVTADPYSPEFLDFIHQLALGDPT